MANHLQRALHKKQLSSMSLNLNILLAQRGFSLVELVIALLFTALLMAGMARVFSGSINTFARSNELMAVQRVNHWALDAISDDVSQAGLLLPERPLSLDMAKLAATEPFFKIQPNQAITVKRPNDAGVLTEEPFNADALQFLMDVPLPVEGVWAVDTQGEADGIAAPDTVVVKLTKGKASHLLPGDMMVILDGGEKGLWEYAMIGTVSPAAVVGQNATFTFLGAAETKLVRYALGQVEGKVINPHKAGVPVIFVRPHQLVRYSVQAVALDPSDTEIKIPCLVKQQTDYLLVAGANGAGINWNTVAAQVVAEHVSGFKVDMSLDGGAGWARMTALSNVAASGEAITWDSIKAAASNQVPEGAPGKGAINDADWFRSNPCLLRLELSIATATRRADYGTPNQRDYGTRTQTLMISPRNFGFGYGL